MSSDNQEDDKQPVMEEPCIKKQTYVTTESEQEVIAPETPSRRRVARVNYSELATGSPARSKRGRSASTESNGDNEKEPKSAVKRKEKCVKMEPIVEDEMSVQITVTATENVEQGAELSEEVPVPITEETPLEIASEMTQKEPESMATEENIEEPIEQDISEPITYEEMIQQDEIANDEDNEIVPEIKTDDIQNETNKPETFEEHPESLQLMEVPKPENLQLMEVTKPDRLQVVIVTKPSQEHPKESNVEDITNNVDTLHPKDEISGPSDEEVIAETDNVDPEPPIEEYIDEMLELTSEKASEPIEGESENNDDFIELRESVESIQEKPVEEVGDNIIETAEKESVESIPEENEPEISPESEENVQIPVEEVSSENIPQEEEIRKHMINIKYYFI